MNTKTPKALYQGKLNIGEKLLDCAVLENETRVISQSAIFKAFGRTKRGRAKDEIRVPNMPSFLDANNLQPFIGEDLRRELMQIEYRNLSGSKTTGYSALILPLICDVYLAAREKGQLAKQQYHLAKAAEILVRSFAKIGIIALIDEATGFQSFRKKDALRFLTNIWLI